MRVLIACEFSGTVRRAFHNAGHDVLSCDLLPADDGSPYHYQGPVEDLIADQDFDLMIAHPPCTYLCSSGLHWNKRVDGREEKTHDAMLFVLNLMGEGFISHDIPKICLENPIGRIGTAYRKADQIIQPYQFGHDASKKTCLWLKGLPPLRPTGMVDPVYGCTCGHKFALKLGKYGCPNCAGEGKARHIWGNQTPTGQNKLGPSADRWALRSVTYSGIAEAMAAQWGGT